MSVVPDRRVSRRHVALISAALLVSMVLVAVLAVAARAQAAELIYWDNYGATPQTISYANIDGTGGGSLNLSGAQLLGPEGMAIDTATGRLFVVSSNAGAAKHGEIDFVNLNGSGAGVFTAPGAPVDDPFGVAVNPVTRTIYWANSGAGEGDGSIAWAKLDGSAGGILNTTGATLVDPYKIGLDPVNGRVYWGNNPPGPGGELSISYANVDNTGGGNLPLSTAPDSAYAFAVDPAAGRLYWSEGGEERFAYTGLLGGVVSTLDTTGAVANSSYGFAIDPTLNRLYWPNYNNGEDRTNGLGFASLSGGGGNITPQVAPFSGPQDLLVLKSPTGTGAPTVTRDAKSRSLLTCSTGMWAGDFAGSYVYQAPSAYVYQWGRNGVAIPGATAATLDAAKAGAYTCAVTASNQAGSASQSSAATQLKVASLKLTVKRKARIKQGGAATFRVKAVNLGDVKSANAKVCVKLQKKAGKILKAPKCKKLGKLAGGGSLTAKLKVKARNGARGTYKVKFQVRGSAGKAAKSKIIVAAPKK
jgi:hypothetical protein